EVLQGHLQEVPGENERTDVSLQLRSRAEARQHELDDLSIQLRAERVGFHHRRKACRRGGLHCHALAERRTFCVKSSAGTSSNALPQHRTLCPATPPSAPLPAPPSLPSLLGHRRRASQVGDVFKTHLPG
ncbi:unnamed protein product, partial [Symbiodinium microadriaticum]